MAVLISGHPVQKSIAIYFHPCNPVLLQQYTYTLFCFGESFYQIYVCIWWHLAMQCAN